MPDSRKILSLLSLLAGAFLAILGLACIGFYIAAVIGTQGQPDRSIIYWYLVFPMTGIPLVGVGIYFVVIGIKARKDPVRYLTRVRYSLIALGVIALVVCSLGILDQVQSDRKREAMIRQEAMLSTLEEEMHKITGVRIDHHDSGGFTFSIAVAPGLPGSYRLISKVADSQAVFLEDSQRMNLDGGETTMTRHVPFTGLFRKCAQDFRDSNVYVCIENTGATSFFTIEAQLELLRDEEGVIEKIEKGFPELKSIGKAGFSLETFTDRQGVRVDRFEPADRHSSLVRP